MGMVKRYAVLRRIDNDRTITPETDGAFLRELQSGLLLALQEQGRLSPMEYRRARERLQQRRERSKQDSQ